MEIILGVMVLILICLYLWIKYLSNNQPPMDGVGFDIHEGHDQCKHGFRKDVGSCSYCMHEESIKEVE